MISSPLSYELVEDYVFQIPWFIIFELSLSTWIEPNCHHPCLGVVSVPSHPSYSLAKSILVLTNTRHSCIQLSVIPN